MHRYVDKNLILSSWIISQNILHICNNISLKTTWFDIEIKDSVQETVHSMWKSFSLYT